MSPTTQKLDHLILFLPVDPKTELPDCPEFFQDNFTCTPGGFHADGATSNTLILLADGCYIELISFVNTALASEHWWGPDAGYVGWKDWCLTNGNSPEDNHKSVSETHGEPIHGGRKRADGIDVKWAVTFPKGDKGGQKSRGRIPFFCHDTTAREVRVPIDDDKVTHSSGALGVLQVTIIVKDQALLDETKEAFSSLFGESGEDALGGSCFKAGRVHEVPCLEGGPMITLRLPTSKEEMEQVEETDFVYGNVVLGAKSSSKNPPGSRIRIDGPSRETDIGGLWIEYI